jgi:hypothetical protein
VACFNFSLDSTTYSRIGPDKSCRNLAMSWHRFPDLARNEGEAPVTGGTTGALPRTARHLVYVM